MSLGATDTVTVRLSYINEFIFEKHFQMSPNLPRLLRLWFHLLIISEITKADESTYRYPQDAIKCHSTQSPNKQIICPMGSMYCVKEITDDSRRDCGQGTEYPFDKWDIKEPGGKCVYKKCGSTCNNGTFVVDNGSESVVRSTFCCEGNLCNSASRISVVTLLGGVVMVTLLLLGN